MKVAIPREVHLAEKRVAATPETVARLVKLGFEVAVLKGAGERARFSDEQYEAAGARTVEDTKELWTDADIVLKVRPPEMHPDLKVHEADLLREGATLISFIWPATSQKILELLAARRATVFAVDQVPRITRAQKMDALSSMANIAGYRAVIEAASFFGRFFTGQITAAGKVPPAKVLVIGAGVAGLAAVGAARGLGAIVRAFDTRPLVKEQVRSMGAEFLEVELIEDGSGEGGYGKEMSPAFIAAEMELFRRQAREVDIIITTALIPGKPAPRLLARDIVEQMKSGSVIVDLAAEAGGNCEMTVPGEVIEHKGVTVIGYVDLPSRLAPTASQLYGSNLVHFLTEMGGGTNWNVDLENEVIRGAVVLKDGQMMWPPPKPKAPPAANTAQASSSAAGADAKALKKKTNGAGSKAIFGGLIAAAFVGLGLVAPAEFLSHFTVFVLACFVGWQVVWNVTPALHTPLMSVTNAISGIILLGGMLKISGSVLSPVTILAGVAVLVATINIAGGFLVTQRMLAMFRK